MIDIKDIRVGNIIGRQFFNPNPANSKIEIDPCKICSIGENTCTVFLGKSKLKVEYKYLESIPITEEWLVKLAATQYHESPILNFYDFPFMKNDFKVTANRELKTFSWYFCSINKEFQCVHQLQNICFALIGEELKEIEK